jgi:putative transposase
MARLPRIVVPGFPHHVAQWGVRSMEIFHSDEDRRAYLTFLSEEAVRFGTDILAWCLMTDHVHFIVVPHQKISLARTFGEAHRRYTCLKNSTQGVRGYLFQGRFSSCVLDAHNLKVAVRFVAWNPVRAGLVETPCEYGWSSARYYEGLDDCDPLVKDRTFQGMGTDWQENQGSVAESESALLRQATRTGRPVGDEKFIEEVESLTGRNVRKKSAGRPRKLH